MNDCSFKLIGTIPVKGLTRHFTTYIENDHE